MDSAFPKGNAGQIETTRKATNARQETRQGSNETPKPTDTNKHDKQPATTGQQSVNNSDDKQSRRPSDRRQTSRKLTRSRRVTRKEQAGKEQGHQGNTNTSKRGGTQGDPDPAARCRPWRPNDDSEGAPRRTLPQDADEGKPQTTTRERPGEVTEKTAGPHNLGPMPT